MSHNTTNPDTLAAMAASYATPVKPNWRDWDPETWSIVTDTDAYKVSMNRQYPPGSTTVFSYIEARGGKFPNTLFFGLQAYLKKLSRPITALEVEFANAMWTAVGEPFPYDEWMIVVNEHKGKIPVQIDAVEEGSVIPVQNALLRIWNTDKRLRILTTWVETSLLRAIWYPTTVATLSWSIKQVIKDALERTADDAVIDSVLPFRLNDFGSRGASSYETAMLGGMSHLVNFMGTDTGPGVLGAMKFYGAELDPTKEVFPGTGIMTSPGYSIPAAEHSTITSWGRENEDDAFLNMLKQFGGPGRLVAVVSDSYDFFAAVERWGTTLKADVEAMGGTLVIRPDSGDPTVVPVQAIDRLGDLFGYTVNTKGYKVLPPCVRVIQGDGIALDTITAILNNLEELGWSAENIAFGMGGALLQASQRDTMRWAMKCSAVLVNGEWRDVFKDPVTDHGKKSKAGRLGLVEECGIGAVSFRTKPLEDIRPDQDLLLPAFVNGDIVRTTTFEEVRARSNDLSPGVFERFVDAA